MRSVQSKRWTKFCVMVALPLVLFVIIYRIRAEVRAEQKRTLVHGTIVTSLAFSPDGAWLLSENKNDLKLWDVKARTLRYRIRDNYGIKAQSVFSRDSKLLIKTSQDGGNEARVNTWDAQTGKGVSEHVIGRKNARIEETALSPDGRFLATADCHRGEGVFTPQGTNFSGLQYSIRLWNAHTGALLRTLLRGSPIWHPQTGVLLKTLPDSPDEVLWLRFSPDGKTLVSASQDEDVQLWDMPSGKLRCTLTGLRAYRGRVAAFSPDSKTVAVSSAGGVEIRAVATGALRKKLAGTSIALCFSPDGGTLASATDAGNYPIELWDVASGQLLQTLTAHRNYVLSLAFSPDGKTLASGSADGTAKLWDLS